MARWRDGLGPVFKYERIAASRRWQTYALRSLFLVMLLAIVSVIWATTIETDIAPRHFLTELAREILLGVGLAQLALVVLVAPAMAAGAISLDRSRGTLLHLLSTDVSNAEIVLGKLVARLFPMLALMACALPFLELLTLLGGVDPAALFAGFVVAASVAVTACSLAMFFSLWMRSTVRALLTTYFCLGIWFIAWSVLDLLAGYTGWRWIVPWRTLDPFYMLTASYWQRGGLELGEYFWFIGLGGAISGFLTCLTVLSFRTVCTRESDKTQELAGLELNLGHFWRTLHRTAPWLTPSLDGSPVVWREWHRNSPSRWRRILAWLCASLVASLTVFAIFWPDREIASIVNGTQVAIGLLMLSAFSASSLAEERVRGSLDLLLCTPLSTWEIVRGKWLGAARVAPFVVILPTTLTGSLAYISGRGSLVASCLMFAYLCCASAAAISLGLLMATWFSRLERALAVTVAVHVAINAGSFLWAMAVGGGTAFDRRAMASPFCWAAQVSFVFGTTHMEAPCDGAIFWMCAFLVLAMALLDRAAADFDRSVGRKEELSTRLARPARAARWVLLTYLALTVMFFSISVRNLEQNLALQFTLGSVIIAGIAASSRGQEFERDNPEIADTSTLSRRRLMLAKCTEAWRYSLGLLAVSYLIIYLISAPNRDLSKEFFYLAGYMLAVHAAAIGAGVAVFAWCPRRFRPAFWAAVFWALVISPWITPPHSSSSILEVFSLSSPLRGIASLVGAIMWSRLAPTVPFEAVRLWIVFFVLFAVTLLVAACQSRARGQVCRLSLWRIGQCRFRE